MPPGVHGAVLVMIDRRWTAATINQLHRTMAGRCALTISTRQKKDDTMTVRIENQTCFFTTENGEEIRLCPDVTIITDSEKAMSAVELDGDRIYITEAEADALTVAGAVDGRKHLKETDSDSVI